MRAPDAVGAQADEHRLGRVGRVQHGDDVVDEAHAGVGGRLGRPVGAAVAPPVVGHDPVGAAEVRGSAPSTGGQWTIGVDGSSMTVGVPDP